MLLRLGANQCSARRVNSSSRRVLGGGVQHCNALGIVAMQYADEDEVKALCNWGRVRPIIDQRGDRHHTSLVMVPLLIASVCVCTQTLWMSWRSGGHRWLSAALLQAKTTCTWQADAAQQRAVVAVMAR